ncbi:MAG: class I SAM-dependent methyltransferase [Spirochaetaceae bacterium]|nr:MAG: class I SAM-dependent methyltransferase [Spirochaetaceae bacterium]
MSERDFFDSQYSVNWKARADNKDYLYDKYARLIENGGNNIRCYQVKRQFDALLKSEGKRILDCACGVGALGIWLALNGKDVCGFDFSETAIGIAVESAMLSGVADKIRFDVMDVRTLAYEDGSFDILTGNDCIHHLINQPAGLRELARVLKPGGKALFVEPLAWNPFINLLRFINTRWNKCYFEHFLTKKEIEFMKSVFGSLSLSEHVVLSSFSRLFARGHATKKLNAFQKMVCILLKKLDDVLLRIMPGFSNLSSMAFIEIVKTPGP